MNGTGWQANMAYGPKLRPLYRLPQIITDPQAVVFFHEGEKAVQAHLAASLGGIPTTSSQGAEKAKYTDFSPLAGRHVVICPDNDEPGERHAEDVAVRVHAAGAASVRVLRLPDLPAKGDVVEWLEAWGTAEAFTALLETAEKPIPTAQVDRMAVFLPVEPVSLDAAMLPALPVDSLPAWFRDMALAVCEATETPIELAAMMGFAVLGTCCQKTFIVSPAPGYVEPLNIWTVASLDSGNRKTAS